jgi:M6 family metalloprotease-like protein
MFLGALLAGTVQMYAVKAYPWPVQVTQPDGSVITIQKHGDEFLHWTTSGGRLVTQGKDGFYYWASFSPEGRKIPTSVRVQQGAMPLSMQQVTPPPAAVERARQKRLEFIQNTVRTKSSSSISIGSKRFLVLLIQFSDLSFKVSNPQQAFSRMLNQDGYAENGATGSVWNYYHENSSGAFNPTFDVVGPITVSKSVAYYGANDEEGNNIYERSRELLIEAARIAHQQLGVNFSVYDNDGDGYVDNVFFFFAGHNEAEGGGKNTIWPHAWNVYEKNEVLDGVRLNSYACTSEFKGAQGEVMSGIGTYCHEFGHVLGLPDFYDTDYEENGQARGLGSFSLMAGGNYNNSGRTPPYLNIEERNLLGWYNNIPLEFTQSKEYFLGPVTDNTCYIHHTSNPNEYFLFEYREKKGWDDHLPATGLLIYHVDKSNNIVGGKTAGNRWTGWDGINAYMNHQCFDLIEAVYPESAVQYEHQVPFPGSTNNTSFTPYTSPAFVGHSGFHTGVGITQIQDLGDRAALTVSTIETDRIEFVGRVTGRNVQPIQSATVTVSFLQENSDANRPASVAGKGSVLQKVARSPQPSQVVETTTDAQGNFSLDFDFQEGTYVIQIAKQGYIPASEEVSMVAPGLFRRDFILNEEGLLKKHYDWNRNWGIGYNNLDKPVYGAVGFSAEELEPYVGDTLQTISFIMFAEEATEVGVYVLFGKEVIFEREVTQYVFNAPVTVNISDAGITIPKGKLVRIGYYVKGADFGYPLAADLGPMAYLGGYSAQSMNGMIQAKPWRNDLGNIIISASVKEGEEPDEPIDPEEDLEIRGTVEDKDGHPLDGVTMKLYYQEPSGSMQDKTQKHLHVAGRLSRAPHQTGTPVATTTTHSGGQYRFETVSRRGTYVVKAEKDGFYPVQRSVEAQEPGTQVVDFTLIDFSSRDGLLRKHGLPYSGLGYGQSGGILYGAAGFSAEEIEQYEGYQLQTISFYVGGTMAEEVGVFVLFDGELVLEETVSEPNYGNITEVDLTQHRLLIPSGKELKVGYYVKESDNGFPLAIDQGPMVPMGAYVGESIEELDKDLKAAYGAHLDYNLIVSATVRKVEKFTIKGTVVDKEGTAKDGVTVKLYHEEVVGDTPQKTKGHVQVAGQLSSAPLHTGTLVSTTTTHSGGQYSFNVKSKAGKYIIKIEKDGFYPAQRTVDAMFAETVVADFILIDFVGSGDGLLRKHGMVKDGLGYQSPGIDTYGAVGFSAEETEAYAGYFLHTIALYAGGSRADEMGVFVMFDGELVLEEIVPNPNFNNVTEVDLKRHRLAIPAGKELKIGYYVKGSDSSYPLAIDDGPMVPMGAYIGQSITALDKDMKEITDGRQDHNIILSATVALEEEELFTLGYYMMPYVKNTYRAGETLILKLNDSPLATHVERPLAVQWLFNDTPYSTGDVLQLETGSHVLKVVLSFEGYIQTIVREIFVE